MHSNNSKENNEQIYKKLIDEKLSEYLKTKYPEQIYEAMEYSISAGGKRLRPILLLAVCNAVGGDISKALPFACSIEMIHTYSLIHDDLPAMDNDDYRRGKLTNHKKFGEAIAILAGDGLLNLAYEIMAKQCVLNHDISMVNAMEEIAYSAGVSGMIGGQVVDIISENKNIDLNTLIFIHEHKTAALIKSAVVSGAIIGKASENKINILKEAGMKLGIAFQIKDDILDVTSTQETLGKPIKSDEKNNKATYVSLFGLEKAISDYKTISKEAVDLFSQLNDKFIDEYIQKLTYREM